MQMQSTKIELFHYHRTPVEYPELPVEGYHVETGSQPMNSIFLA